MNTGPFKKRISCFSFLLFLLFSFLINSCIIKPENRIFFNKKRLKRIHCIAVLPFCNLTNMFNAETILPNAIMAKLIKTERFDIVKYGEIKNLLLDNKITNISPINIEMLHLFRKSLKVDTVIIGTIYKYNEPGKGSQQSNIDLTISVIDTKSGDTLWYEEIYEKGSSRGFLLENGSYYPCFGLVEKLSNRFVDSLMFEMDRSLSNVNNLLSN